MIGAEEVEKRFAHHPPDEASAVVHEHVRTLFKDFVGQLDQLMPATSRELSLMHTQMEQAAFWAHAHIARNVSPSGAD